MRKPKTRSRPITLAEIKAARQDLVEMGLLVDSGQREWCEETGRYEIVWALASDMAGGLQ
jgi:hypothetical protein